MNNFTRLEVGFQVSKQLLSENGTSRFFTFQFLIRLNGIKNIAALLSVPTAVRLLFKASLTEVETPNTE